MIDIFRESSKSVVFLDQIKSHVRCVDLRRFCIAKPRSELELTTSPSCT